MNNSKKNDKRYDEEAIEFHCNLCADMFEEILNFYEHLEQYPHDSSKDHLWHKMSEIKKRYYKAIGEFK